MCVRSPCTVVSAFLIAVALHPSISLAQSAEDSCRDVLINKVMDVESYKRDSLFLLTLATQSKEYISSRNNSKDRLGFDIEGIKGNLTHENVRQFEHQILNSLDLTKFHKDRVDYFLMQGSENLCCSLNTAVAQAWARAPKPESKHHHSI
jgi:hypothetical protein